VVESQEAVAITVGVPVSISGLLLIFITIGVIAYVRKLSKERLNAKVRAEAEYQASLDKRPKSPSNEQQV
jgi:hypothetical protein